jgi:hypothetical protein
MKPEVPEFTVVGDAYRFDWPAYAVQAEISHLADSRDGIYGELIIRAGADGLLYASRVNLLSAPTHHVRTLKERIDLEDWFGMLQAMCFLAVDRYRQGDQPVPLAKVNWRERPRWILEPFIEHGGPTVLYAESASGKSTISLAMAYTVASGIPTVGTLRCKPMPVLYLDWETDAETHAERMEAIAAAHGFGEMPETLHYLRMRRSLPDSAEGIREKVAQLHVGLVVVDSLGAAGAGRAKEEDAAISIFAALRSFSTAALGVHHKRKGSPGDTSAERDRMYGSVYYVNLARLVWEVTGRQSDDEGPLQMALINRKHSNVKGFNRYGYEVTYESDGDDRLSFLKFIPRDLRDMAEFHDKLSLAERCRMELAGGAMTNRELAEAIGEPEKEGTIKTRMNEERRKGRIIQLPDGRWGLAQRH